MVVLRVGVVCGVVIRIDWGIPWFVGWCGCGLGCCDCRIGNCCCCCCCCCCDNHAAVGAALRCCMCSMNLSSSLVHSAELTAKSCQHGVVSSCLSSVVCKNSLMSSSHRLRGRELCLLRGRLSLSCGSQCETTQDHLSCDCCAMRRDHRHLRLRYWVVQS